jgi:hypothetical protein
MVGCFCCLQLIDKIEHCLFIEEEICRMEATSEELWEENDALRLEKETLATDKKALEDRIRFYQVTLQNQQQMPRNIQKEIQQLQFGNETLLRDRSELLNRNAVLQQRLDALAYALDEKTKQLDALRIDLEAKSCSLLALQKKVAKKVGNDWQDDAVWKRFWSKVNYHLNGSVERARLREKELALSRAEVGVLKSTLAQREAEVGGCVEIFLTIQDICFEEVHC